MSQINFSEVHQDCERERQIDADSKLTAELDRLRAENARLVGEVKNLEEKACIAASLLNNVVPSKDSMRPEKYARFIEDRDRWFCGGWPTSSLVADLQLHKQALVEARAALKLELNTPSSREAIATINELIKSSNNETNG